MVLTDQFISAETADFDKLRVGIGDTALHVRLGENNGPITKLHFMVGHWHVDFHDSNIFP